MREIKFRAWDESQNYMAYQGTPDLESIQSFMHHFGDKTLMQFTGLKDKKGVEIYEGDWLYDKEFDENGVDISTVFAVEYDVQSTSFVIDNSFKRDGSSLVSFVEYFGLENLEVVGNIYENPELHNTIAGAQPDA